VRSSGWSLRCEGARNLVSVPGIKHRFVGRPAQASQRINLVDVSVCAIWSPNKGNG
jgi:hypothetical protein